MENLKIIHENNIYILGEDIIEYQQVQDIKCNQTGLSFPMRVGKIVGFKELFKSSDFLSCRCILDFLTLKIHPLSDIYPSIKINTDLDFFYLNTSILFRDKKSQEIYRYNINIRKRKYEIKSKYIFMKFFNLYMFELLLNLTKNGFNQEVNKSDYKILEHYEHQAVIYLEEKLKIKVVDSFLNENIKNAWSSQTIANHIALSNSGNR